MTWFYEGQEVEVYTPSVYEGLSGDWRKAKIIIGPEIWVEFANGSRGVYPANRIRQFEKANDNEDDELESGVLLTKEIDDVLAEDE